MPYPQGYTPQRNRRIAPYSDLAGDVYDQRPPQGNQEMFNFIQKLLSAFPTQALDEPTYNKLEYDAWKTLMANKTENRPPEVKGPSRVPDVTNAFGRSKNYKAPKASEEWTRRLDEAYQRVLMKNASAWFGNR